MNSTFHYEIAKARVADIHQQAHRDAMCRAAREGRSAPKNKSARPAPRFPAVAVRRMLTVLGAHA